MCSKLERPGIQIGTYCIVTDSQYKNIQVLRSELQVGLLHRKGTARHVGRCQATSEIKNRCSYTLINEILSFKRT